MTTLNLTGAWYSSRNAGDQAILITIRELLEERLPGLELRVICQNDQFVHEEHDLAAISQFKNLPGVYRSIVTSNGLLIGGGTPLYNDFKHMVFFWTMALAAKIARRRVIYYGASSQSLNRWWSRFFARRILKLCDLITVREPVTEDRFRKLVPSCSVKTYADPAITLKPCEPGRVNEIFELEGIDTGQDVFAVCPHFFSNTDSYRVHHYEEFDDSVIEKQRVAVSAVCSMLAKRGQVVLLPMNIDPPDSDVDVMEEIYKSIPEDERESVVLVRNQYRPKEIAGMFQRCKLVVGTRLHALIMAAAVDASIVAIDYAPKVKGFMALIEQQANSLPIYNLSAENLIKVVEHYLDRYETVREEYLKGVKKASDAAKANADAVAKLFI